MSQRRRRLDATLRGLAVSAPLSEAETQLVERCAERVQDYRVGRQIVAEGAPRRPTIILTGWACRQRVLHDGRRQVFELLVPGDITGFSVLPDPETTGLTALTRVETADATPLRAAALDAGAHPGLARAMATTAQRHQVRMLDQVVRLGRHTAYERTTHLLLETTERLTAVGLGEGRTFPFPATQQVLADLLGLSMVHMNRTLQQLRREQLIELRAGTLVVLDMPKLAAVIEGLP